MTFAWPTVLSADERPYLTTKDEITLISANDGETDLWWRTTTEGLRDFQIKTRDSFTVIRLGPDHPPITRTVYGTVPCTIAGTPTMAISSDGRFGLITNHGYRPEDWGPLSYPDSEPLANDDVDNDDLTRQEPAPPLSDMISMIDLANEDFRVVDRFLFEDHPVHVLPHPDGKHFVVGASRYFYVFKIEDGKLLKVRRSLHDRGFPCFWITPSGDRIIATQGQPPLLQLPTSVHWYSFTLAGVRHISDIRVLEGTDTQLIPESFILRVSPDGTKALVCQNSQGGASRLCDVPVVDLTRSPPVINSVIKQVGHGVESFAFHPDGKMAVVTCLSEFNNSIAVLDIESDPPRILYHLDAGGVGQGIEFTPEGDKLFVGSAAANRIDVFDVIGEFELRKNPKFLKTGRGHCSLTLGPTYEE
jgi:hypothetical protein